MSDINYPDAHIRQILTSVKTIALVGASDKSDRPSHEVMEFLLSQGYEVIPVNPRLAGAAILGQTTYADLVSIPKKVDMVELFINPDRVTPFAEQAIEINAHILWMQIGVINQEAEKLAKEAGLTVIMNRCPKREIPRLGLLR